MGDALALFGPAAPEARVTFPEPRPFQVTAHAALREGMRAGHSKQLLVAPTGSGKTYLGLRVIYEALKKGKRGLFVCDRTALIEQTSGRADSYGLTGHGIVQANHWRRDNSLPFQIASIQTIEKRGYWPLADVIVLDEAHTVYSAVREHLERTNAAVVGLTATPCTRGLGRLYTNMVNAATMSELTDSGVLVPLRILSCVTPDMAGAKTAGGEWTAKAASEREAQIIGDVVAEWQAHGENRKTIAFGPDIAYCNALVQRFNAAGIAAAAYTSGTGDDERAMLLREFSAADPGIRILVSVEALAKGFDVQDIGCVIDARPLRKSLSTAIQMWGRGLRASTETGKADCLLLDHSGNIRRFYDDFVDVYFNGFMTLDTAEKLDAKPRPEPEPEPGPELQPTGCPQCGFKPFRKRCLSCGYERIKPVLEDAAAGVMQQITIGKKVLATDRYDLWRQLCGYARKSSKPERQRGRASHLYQDITGEKPPPSWRFDETEDAPITRATLNKIISLGIAHSKRREAARAAS